MILKLSSPRCVINKESVQQKYLPTDSGTRKTHQQTSKDTYIYSFFTYACTVTEWNSLPECCIQSQTVDTFR
jgi:hypothetical protein